MHVADTRGLLPTEEEYRGSAALLVWLCAQHGQTNDRTNILGHAEPDPHTSQRDVLVVRQLAILSSKAWMR